MIKQLTYILTITSIFILNSCSAPKHFYDTSSFERQKELKKDRSKNVFSDIALGIISAFSSAALEVDVGWYPSEQEFKKMKLINPTSDTIYVNMFTDVY